MGLFNKSADKMKKPEVQVEDIPDELPPLNLGKKTQPTQESQEVAAIREIILSDQDVQLYLALLRGKTKFELLNKL